MKIFLDLDYKSLDSNSMFSEVILSMIIRSKRRREKLISSASFGSRSRENYKTYYLMKLKRLHLVTSAWSWKNLLMKITVHLFLPLSTITKRAQRSTRTWFYSLHQTKKATLKWQKSISINFLKGLVPTAWHKLTKLSILWTGTPNFLQNKHHQLRI